MLGEGGLEPLAQPVEHLPFKQRAPGSNPGRLTNNIFKGSALSA